MEPTSAFARFNKMCDFFHDLKPNLAIHYSTTKQEFVVTAGRYSMLPGASYIADTLKGRDPKDTVQTLETLFSEFSKDMTQELNKEMFSARREETEKLIRDFKEVKQKFQSAKSGQRLGDQKGGLEGLAATIGDAASSKKIEELIKRTERTIDQAIMILNNKETLDQSKILEESDFESPEKLEEESELSSEELMEEFEMVEPGRSSPVQEEKQAAAPDLKKMLLYYITYSYNNMMNVANPITGWDWWNKVLDNEAEQIYIGAIPVSTKFGTDHGKDLNAIGVKAVLSVVEPFELNSAGPLTTPITGERWKALKINHLELPTEDYKTIALEDIEKGVEFIRKNTQSGNPVYVHCKAGRGRSVLVVVCYLIKYHGMTANQAIAHVKEHRLQAGIERAKLETAKEYERRCRENPVSSQSPISSSSESESEIPEIPIESPSMLRKSQESESDSDIGEIIIEEDTKAESEQSKKSKKSSQETRKT